MVVRTPGRITVPHMTNTRTSTRWWKKTLLCLALAAAGTTGTVAAASPANADTWWPVVYSSCPGNQWVVINMYVTKGAVKVGWGPNPSSATSGSGGWTTLYPTGWRSIHMDAHHIYWDKWQSPGVVTSWTKSCVNYT